eukprot:1158434-Pelagomonas_calceolata.AAC.11
MRQEFRAIVFLKCKDKCARNPVAMGEPETGAGSFSGPQAQLPYISEGSCALSYSLHCKNHHSTCLA